jgi:Polysulphide reductase, NrfD
MSSLSASPKPHDRRERRLEEIRRQAETRDHLRIVGPEVEGAPFPQANGENGYYRTPLLKQPPWTWEIPLYFFVGGASAAAGIIGAIADYTGADRKLIRHARWIAASGSVISPALLITDLGRPARFLNMLRVFKPQSAMSIGVWTLLGFSSGAAATALADFMQERYGPSLPLRVLENAGQVASLAFGLPFSNYTGVLIGATSIPVWNHSAADLPVHFGASGLGAAVGLLELMGNRRHSALEALALGAAIFETVEGLRIEMRSHAELAPLKRGASGWITRAGGVLSGPFPLLLRAASIFGEGKHARSLTRFASWSAVAGSLLTRVGWVYAGHVSARDWRLPLEDTRSRDARLRNEGPTLRVELAASAD